MSPLLGFSCLQDFGGMNETYGLGMASEHHFRTPFINHVTGLRWTVVWCPRTGNCNFTWGPCYSCYTCKPLCACIRTKLDNKCCKTFRCCSFFCYTRWPQVYSILFLRFYFSVTGNFGTPWGKPESQGYWDFMCNDYILITNVFLGFWSRQPSDIRLTTCIHHSMHWMGLMTLFRLRKIWMRMTRLIFVHQMCHPQLHNLRHNHRLSPVSHQYKIHEQSSVKTASLCNKVYENKIKKNNFC